VFKKIADTSTKMSVSERKHVTNLGLDPLSR
jgi:hypothetical protein